MNWEIFSYGNGEFLRLVFNGIAAIVGDGDFIAILKISGLVGLLWVMVEAAFRGRAVNLQWLLAVVLVVNVVLVPRTNVIITDRIDVTQSGVVGNVPLGLAMFAGGASKIGDWMTRAFETVFSLPDDIQYHKSGMLFGQYLVEASTRFEITDSRVAGNLAEFWQSCVFYDLLLGLYTWDDLLSATDTLEFLKGHTSQSRSYVHTDAAGSRDTVVCRVGANGVLGTEINATVDNARTYYGRKLVKAPDQAAAVARFAAAMPISYQYIAGLSMSAEQIIRQNALANSLRRGLTQFAARVDAGAAAQDFALARAEQERRTTFAAMGELAGRTLPLLRGIFESFIYAIFPVVLMLLILPAAAKVALTYLKALLWIQLWAPLYALLHFAMTFFSQFPAQSGLVLPTGYTALSMATHTALGQVMSDVSAVAGYLSLSIPMISYLVINQGGAMMASLAARVAGSYEAPVSKGADEASTGNISLGNTSLGNASWWQQNTSPSFRTGTTTITDPETGVTYTTTGAGAFMQVPQSDLPFSASISNAVKSNVQSQLSRSLQTAETQMADYSTNTAAVFNQMERFLHQAGSETAASDTWRHGEGATFRQEHGEVQRLQEEFGRTHGLDKKQATELLASAGLAIGSLDKMAPAEQQSFLSRLASKIPLSASVGLRGINQATLKQAWQDAVKFGEDTQYGRHWQAMEEAARSTAAQVSEKTGDSLAAELAGGLQRQEALRESAQASLQEARGWQESLARMEEQGVAFNAEAGMAVRQWAIGREMGMFAGPGMGSGARWTAQEIDHHLARAANGDLHSLGIIQHLAGGFIREQGLELAGVAAAPGPEGVRAAGEAALAGVRAQGAGIDNAGDFYARQAHAAGEEAGVPDEAGVTGRAETIREETEGRRAATADDVEAGRTKVDEGGRPIREEAREEADPETRVVTLGDVAPTTNQLITPSQRQWLSDKLGGGYKEEG
ncbi:conjugal transfer protein TraG N-terminal domain-containing protein [Thioalbus denitrificans]|uniref:TraG-like protein n=1 Tax=Thioalbus denitrificans TaxID=547122 RepID=A0A369C268_9GAMM|nr:conjugal transfer protein TraG N-terminal domain-containing protein [Thioalbus denitrificans]RCX27989.1 TraG-like protein [Thioalbus denitrificans]